MRIRRRGTHLSSLNQQSSVVCSMEKAAPFAVSRPGALKGAVMAIPIVIRSFDDGW